jgi:RNA polymerase sigma factor (sigma-70 family)
VVSRDDALAFLDLDLSLQRLEKHDPRLVRVVECRFFAGLTEQETADALGVSRKTVQRDWKRARGWLKADLPELME